MPFNPFGAMRSAVGAMQQKRPQQPKQGLGPSPQMGGMAGKMMQAAQRQRPMPQQDPSLQGPQAAMGQAVGRGGGFGNAMQGLGNFASRFMPPQGMQRPQQPEGTPGPATPPEGPPPPEMGIRRPLPVAGEAAGNDMSWMDDAMQQKRQMMGRGLGPRMM